jgi:hypothetical protein
VPSCSSTCSARRINCRACGMSRGAFETARPPICRCRQGSQTLKRGATGSRLSTRQLEPSA